MKASVEHVATKFAFTERRACHLLRVPISSYRYQPRLHDDGQHDDGLRERLVALARKIELVHIQPGKPTQNGHVESFNGKLREECLRIHWFQNLFEARRILTNWRRDYNERRPHSSLNYLTPTEFAAKNCDGKDADFVHLENAVGVFHFTTAAAAG